jgi:hypothetical protein
METASSTGGGGSLDKVIAGFVGDFETVNRVLTFDAVEALDIRLDQDDAGRSSTSVFERCVCVREILVALWFRGLHAPEGGRRVVEAACAAGVLGLRTVEAWDRGEMVERTEGADISLSTGVEALGEVFLVKTVLTTLEVLLPSTVK